MTIYVFSGSYSLVVIGAESEERAREIAEEAHCVSLEYHKLTDTYEDGEEFIEMQEG